jgi:hydantoinase/carbamoylase family amidase
VAAPDPERFGPRILALADQLAKISDTADGLSCIYMSPAHRKTAAELRDWFETDGMAARIDEVGNVIGRYAASRPDAKVLMIGSHYDTVRNAGKYDGRLGILTGLVVVEYLRRTGKVLPFHLELVAFSEEEGVRFGYPFIGSGALAGKFDASALNRRDAGGKTLHALLTELGFDPGGIPALARPPGELLGYLEVHIEQGPVLLQEDQPVGVVTSIAGPVRIVMTVTGTAGHAGTVPMDLRRDAAAAAAEIVLAVERRCRGVPTLVGTVGIVAIPNAAMNVIPGRCELSLDIRAADDATRDTALADILAEIGRIATRRRVSVETTEIARASAVPCSGRLQKLLGDSASSLGIEPRFLPSGAGHDAMMFDGVTDLAMLFVRCGNGGISHSPLETITAQDAGIAAQVLLNAILNFKPAS